MERFLIKSIKRRHDGSKKTDSSTAADSEIAHCSQPVSIHEKPGTSTATESNIALCPPPVSIRDKSGTSTATESEIALCPPPVSIREKSDTSSATESDIRLYPQPVSIPDQPGTSTETESDVALCPPVSIRHKPGTSVAIDSGIAPPAKKRKVLFCESWFNDVKLSSWLTKKDGSTPSCRVCEVTLPFHKPALIRHSESKRHVSLMSQIKKNKKLEEAWNTNKGDIKQKVRRAEIKLSAFLASHNLPFTVIDSLTPLLADVFPDSTIAKELKLGRTKATAIVKNILAPEFEKQLNDNMRGPTNFFSLIMDETTDCSVKKQCAYTVIYYDQHNSVKTMFLDMKEASSGSAEDLYQCLQDTLAARNIPIQNLVGFSSDTTNSMFGEHNSMFTRLKEENPAIVCVKCSCHLIHLAASKACLKLPKSVEDLLRNIGAYFSRSSARIKKLQEMQEFFKVEVHKILTVATTRWLSVKQCVDRVLEQYDVLVNYFRVDTFEDPSRINDDIYNSLNNKFSRIYFEFLSYVLGILTEFNLLFQSESPLLYKLKPSVNHLVQTIAVNYMKLSSCKNKTTESLEFSNPRHYLPLKDLYLGVAAHESLQEIKKEANPPPESELETFRKSCLTFYVELLKQITTRFNFNDEIFDIIEIVDPMKSQESNLQNVHKILTRFPRLKENHIIDIQRLEQEWKEYALLDIEGHKKDTVEEFWKMVFEIKDLTNNPKFPNLKVVISLLMILPFSNASVERVFSSLKRIKTEDRNKLHTYTIASLMKTSQGIKEGGGCVRYEPPTKMLKAKITYD